MIENMEVYLVRHGKSADHEGDKRQSPDSPLGLEGIKQANALAQRMGKEKIDVVLSSKWDRARKTAQIVSKKIGKELETFEGIHEKEQNPSLYGANMNSDIQKKYIEEVEKFGSDLDWKFEGKGESIRDVIKRAASFKDHLISHHNNQNILVVTHGLFIRCFVILALLGEDYDDKVFSQIFRSISVANTSITLLEYVPDRKHWELRYLNDHLHIR
ncbi:MAG TPA: histidine phosphatase family protein [Patescibacteria group bacterium]